MQEEIRQGGMRRNVRHRIVNARDRLLRAQSLNLAGQTPYEEIHQQDLFRLRYYPPLQEDTIDLAGEPLPVRREVHRTPLVIVPPLAVNMLIYDLFPQRSLVRYFRSQGYELYLVDWGRPERLHDEYHLVNYIAEFLPDMIARVREHAGADQLSLHGWSMGGMFSYCFAALEPATVRNLVLLGPPCDYHAPGGANWQNRLLSRQIHGLSRRTGWRVHDSRKRWWRAPGWANSLAFKLVSPQGTIKGYTELARNLHDREYVINHATNSAFLDDMVAYPGGVIQDVVQFLLTDNCLAHGLLPIHESSAKLANVTANTLIIIGDRDPIVPPKSSQRLLELISSGDASQLTVPGGHMSIVSGGQAPRAIWPQVNDWLAARSG